MGQKDYILTQEMLSKIRVMNESKISSKRILTEEEEKEDREKAIPITNDPKFGQNVLQNQIDSFRKTVSGGAKFANENNEDAESNPLVYYPKSGNLVFSGSIPNLSGLKFQYSLNDVTNAPYIFVDGLALTDDVLDMLRKMNGHYKNWKESWEISTDLLDKLKDNQKG